MKKGTDPTLEVIVATHKLYTMPDDPLYRPLLVGSHFFQAEHSDTRPTSLRFVLLFFDIITAILSWKLGFVN